MPNQILDKKESLKDSNNKIELENHEEKLRNEVTNSNNDNTTLISSKQQKDNYNTLKFLDNISSFQEQTTLLHDISNKSIQ